ncbi:MAG: extensin family protein [Pseudorhodoplanes sp.]
MTHGFLIAILLAAVGPAVAADEVPLPRARPAEAQAAVDYGIRAVAEPPDQASPCQLRMTERIVAVFQSMPAIAGPGVCGAPDTVKLETIFLPDNSRVAVSPPAVLRCTMAEAITHWVREVIAPAVAASGAPLRALDNYGDYECRGRNRVIGARVSEHGHANALDIRGFRLADNRFVGLTDRTVARELREGVRRSVCERFATVLGPGSDGYHEDHVHLDLAERRNNYKLCQWNVLDPVPEVPLPRPRPSEAPQREG